MRCERSFYINPAYGLHGLIRVFWHLMNRFRPINRCCRLSGTFFSLQILWQMSLKRRFCECTTRFLPHYVFHNFLCSLSYHRLSMQNTHAKNTSGLRGLKQNCTVPTPFSGIVCHVLTSVKCFVVIVRQRNNFLVQILLTAN